MDYMISIVVPVYNSEKYLSKCIISILSQTFEEFELILVNDGSTDNSKKICENYAKQDKRVKVINTINSGVSNARNLGIDNSRGRYIVFCDSDDYVAENWCEELFKCIKDNKDSFVICGYKIYNNRNNCKKEEDVTFNSKKNINKLQKKDFYQLYEKKLLNSPCNKIFNRNIILKSNIRYRQDLSLGEDLIFNLQYLKAISSDTIIVINSSLYNYILKEKESLDYKYYNNLYEIYKLLYEELYNNMVIFGSNFILYKESYYISYFYAMEKVLKNTFSKNNNSNLLDKYRYNNHIIKSNEFKECIKYLSHKKINILYLAGLKTNSYLIICLSSILTRFLSRIKVIIKKFEVERFVL